MTALLEVNGLRTHFFTSAGVVKAVDGITFDLMEGESLAIVGESGCGKSITALSIMRLIPSPPGRILGGSIRFMGEDLLAQDDKAMRDIRGNRIGMVFQEPMTSLNPVLTIGRQLTEAVQRHLGHDNEAAHARASELLELVGIPDAANRLRAYPHEFSGGMRQRVMIAMALSCSPKLLIADEPTTALDVTIQAQILELIQQVQRELGIAVIIITHNLGVVARYVDRINVMYAGRIVERGTLHQVFDEPQHPYTKGLLASVPRLDKPKGERLIPIEGMPPDLSNLPPGCAFRERCAYAIARCEEDVPEVRHVRSAAAEHHVACWAVETGSAA
ncbi:MAG: ABC transporter ATP-binding protein [Chloroflexi bacterium]|nr:ABC transporter ATP-binding protein [Chloroflexota bacterium]